MTTIRGLPIDARTHELKVDYVRRKQGRVRGTDFGNEFWNGIQLPPEMVPECTTHQQIYHDTIRDKVPHGRDILITCSRDCLWHDWFVTQLRNKEYTGQCVFRSCERRGGAHGVRGKTGK